MEIENNSYLYLGIHSISFLGVMALLQFIEPNYVTLTIQYGFMLILDSLGIPYTNESQYETFIMAIISGLNAIGYFTLFAAITKIDLLVVMLVFNFKILLNHSMYNNQVSTIMFLFGFILNLMSNDHLLAIWALVLGQICHVISNILEQKQKLFHSNLQLFKGTFLIMMGVLNFGFYSDSKQNSFFNYIFSFSIAIMLLILQAFKQEIKNNYLESAMIGLQLLILLLNHEYQILPTISCVFYFFGILCLYIKK